MGDILAFLGALPDLIKLINELMAFIRRVSGGDVPGFLSKMTESMSALNTAKTPQETDDALKKVQAALAGK